MKQSFYLITGVMASGKSTTAQALAERLPRCVHLRGDVFRRLILTGRVALPAPPAAPGPEPRRGCAPAHRCRVCCDLLPVRG